MKICPNLLSPDISKLGKIAKQVSDRHKHDFYLTAICSAPMYEIGRGQFDDIYFIGQFTEEVRNVDKCKELESKVKSCFERNRENSLNMNALRFYDDEKNNCLFIEPNVLVPDTYNEEIYPLDRDRREGLVCRDKITGHRNFQTYTRLAKQAKKAGSIINHSNSLKAFSVFTIALRAIYSQTHGYSINENGGLKKRAFQS